MRMPLSLRIKYSAGRYLPFLKVAPPPEKQAVFHLRPVRNDAIEWQSNDDGEALLTVPRRNDRVGKLVGFCFRVPDAKAVQLDEVGTFVWQLCDGSSTVEGIVKQTCKEYKLNRREVEISVTTYLQMLSERNFIGFYQREGKKR